MSFKQSHPQLAKELRPLLLPWGAAVIAGSLIGLRPFSDGVGFDTWLKLVVSNGFLGGLALAATMVFGHELQERTLPLILTQPMNRSDLWLHKTLVMSGAVLAGVLVEYGLLGGISNWFARNELWEAIGAAFQREEIWLGAVFLVATVCSCGFWTLFAGSVVGGLVFTVVSQLLSGLVVALVWGRIRGYDGPFEDPLTLFVLAGTGLVYSGTFLWLGWRRFIWLEVRAPSFGEGWAGSTTTGRSPAWAEFLVCRPNHRLLNLARKELRLQKPIAQLAAAFVACWVGVVLLQLVRPGQNITYLFDIMTCLFAPVSSLLAGCISLGEEKALGLTAAQLTLPISSWRQWLIKVLVGAGTAALLSLGLPILLFLVTGTCLPLQSSGLMNSNDNGIEGLAIISGLMFLLGFWASGLSPNTVRAALIAVASIITLPAFAILGIYLGTGASGPSGGQAFWGLLDALIAFTVLILGQSLWQFRRCEERKTRLVFCFFTLAGLITLVSFGATCFG